MRDKQEKTEEVDRAEEIIKSKEEQLEDEYGDTKKQLKEKGPIRNLMSALLERRVALKKLFIIFLLLGSFLTVYFRVLDREYPQRELKETVYSYYSKESQALYFIQFPRLNAPEEHPYMHLGQGDTIYSDELKFQVRPLIPNGSLTITVQGYSTTTKEVQRNVTRGNKSKIINQTIIVENIHWNRSKVIHWTNYAIEANRTQFIEDSISLKHNETREHCRIFVNGRRRLRFYHKSHPLSSLRELTQANIIQEKRRYLEVGFLAGIVFIGCGGWFIRQCISPERKILWGILIGYVGVQFTGQFIDKLIYRYGITSPYISLLYGIPAFFVGMFWFAGTGKMHLFQNINGDKEWNALPVKVVEKKEEGQTVYYGQPSWVEFFYKIPMKIRSVGYVENKMDNNLTKMVLVKGLKRIKNKLMAFPSDRFLKAPMQWGSGFLEVEGLVKLKNRIKKKYFDLKRNFQTKLYEKAEEIALGFFKSFEDILSSKGEKEG